jgi:hypothetical protein
VEDRPVWKIILFNQQTGVVVDPGVKLAKCEAIVAASNWSLDRSGAFAALAVPEEFGVTLQTRSRTKRRKIGSKFFWW